MPHYPQYVQDQYASWLQRACAPFLGRPIDQFQISRLRDVVRTAQREFLYEYPEYVVFRDAIVNNDGSGHFTIDAPISTFADKCAAEAEANMRERLFEEFKANEVRRYKEQSRRAANMRRLHRRLMRRHADKIPIGMRPIWSSLTDGQQYAILKDIDYTARHGAPK